MAGRRLMTTEGARGQYNVNMQRFEHDMVSVRQGGHKAWLIDTPQRMVSLKTDSCSAVPPRPSVSESVLRVSLGVTVFCILALPRVTLGVTAKEVNKDHLAY